MFKRMHLFASVAIVATPLAAQPGPPQIAPSPQASIIVPRAVLERYAGCYELNGTVANVSVSPDARLTVHLVDQNVGPPLRALSGNEFVADAIGLRLVFEGEGPQATRIRSFYAGSEVIGRRIPAASDGCPATASFDAGARANVIEALSTALRQRYVILETGERIAASLEAELASGEYDNLADPAAFAARLDSDLSAIANDKHLRILAANAAAPAPPPPAGPLPRQEAGVVRADQLSGGIGYIEVIGFPPPQAFKPVIDRAMEALRGSKALIIDMRRNGGGAAESVAYLTSFLVPSGTPTHLNDLVARVPNTTEFVRTEQRSSPTPISFAGVPVYVLTSPVTFSGGEGFAYEVQALGLGKVIGDVTGGGANPTAPIPLGNGITAMIPFARAESPITKTNWEGRGVQPDLLVPAAEALKTALEQLGQAGIADVAAASREQVFAPRAVALPGMETALRSLIAGIVSGTPDYAAMTPQFAELARQQLPQWQETVRPLGEIKSVEFLGPVLPAGDLFEVTFANGKLQIGVALGPDGKIVDSRMLPGRPQI